MRANDTRSNSKQIKQNLGQYQQAMKRNDKSEIEHRIHIKVGVFILLYVESRVLEHYYKFL